MRPPWSLIGLAGLALAVAQPAAAQGAPGSSVADRPMTAKQNGRTVASTRTDAMGEFRFDLTPGVYELCVGPPTRTRGQTLPDRGPPVPGNGGRAGGQALAGGGEACFPHTAALPDNASRRSEPVPVTIVTASGDVLVVYLDMMRTSDGPGGTPVGPLPDLPGQARTAAAGGGVRVATGDVNGDGLAATGTNSEGHGGRRVDPRIPPPAGLRIAADTSTLRASTQFVTVVGTLSLER